MNATTGNPFLVLGATGGQGGAVADALLARDARVRAMVRRPDEPAVRRLTDRGVEVVTGSLDDPATLGAAMRDVAGAFAMTTPFEAGVEAEMAQGRAIVAAAADRHVPHLVFSSVAAADQQTGFPHFDSKAIIEKDLTASGLPYTITAPTYFFDNALGGLDRIYAGILDLPLPPDRPLQQVARPDLGGFRREGAARSDAVRRGLGTSWPVTPRRRHKWPRRSARPWAEPCGPSRPHWSRSAIPICMRCGRFSTIRAIG